MKHPNIDFTADGKEEIYQHGSTSKARGTIILNNTNDIKDYTDINELGDIKMLEKLGSNYEIITSEELVERFYNGGF